MAKMKVGKTSPIKGKLRKSKYSFCEVCGDMFVAKSNKAGRFCSFDCYKKYRRETGKIVNRHYSSKVHIQWAEMIKERDGKCVRCGAEDKLIAHHIVSVKKDFSKALDISNGQSLCYSCHNIVHNNILNVFMKKGMNSGKPRTGNPEPSRVEPRKVQRLLEDDTSSLITSMSVPPEREEIV